MLAHGREGIIIDAYMTREEKAMYCIEHPKESPAFQFYPTDWFGSRHVAGMSPSEKGIHSSLIFAAWLEPVCGFPIGAEFLTARVPELFQKECEKVLSWCWFQHENLWFNERLLDERIKQVELSIKRIETGSMGGRPSSSKIKSTNYKNNPIDNQLDSKSKPNDNQIGTKRVIGIGDGIEEEKEIGKEEENIKELVNSEYRKCSVHLRNRILERRSPKIDELKLIKWDRDVRLMIERDGRSISDIESIIDECHDMEPTASGFSWRDNILSMGTIRERWNEGKISIGMNSQRKPSLHASKKQTIDISIIKNRVVRALGTDYQNFPDDEDTASWILLHETHCCESGA